MQTNDYYWQIEKVWLKNDCYGMLNINGYDYDQT